MKNLLILIFVCFLTMLLEGCIVLNLKLDEDGFSIGAGVDIPDMPEFDITKTFGE